MLFDSPTKAATDLFIVLIFLGGIHRDIGSFVKLGSCVGLCGFANVPMWVG